MAAFLLFWVVGELILYQHCDVMSVRPKRVPSGLCLCAGPFFRRSEAFFVVVVVVYFLSCCLSSVPACQVTKRSRQEVRGVVHPHKSVVFEEGEAGTVCTLAHQIAEHI